MVVILILKLQWIRFMKMVAYQISIIPSSTQKMHRVYYSMPTWYDSGDNVANGTVMVMMMVMVVNITHQVRADAHVVLAAMYIMDDARLKGNHHYHHRVVII